MAKRDIYTGELLHFNAVRMRVTGSGNLLLSLGSLDDVTIDTLPTLPLSATTDREPVSLANLINQRARLIGTTTVIDETFTISKIVIFIRPSATQYPQ